MSKQMKLGITLGFTLMTILLLSGCFANKGDQLAPGAPDKEEELPITTLIVEDGLLHNSM